MAASESLEINKNSYIIDENNNLSDPTEKETGKYKSNPSVLLTNCKLDNVNDLSLGKTSIPADTQDFPLWSYVGRAVPDHNRTKIGRIRFLTYFGFAMSGMHLASGNIEKIS